MEQKEIKVLIADDEEDILQFISYNLEKEGYRVHTAADGQLCLDLAKEVVPDLILLDVTMPKIDGIEVCQQLRDMPQFSETPIALLTARNEDYSQLAGFEAGADDYMTKPIRPKILMARIKALLKRKRISVDDETIENYGCLQIDKEKHLVIRDDEQIELPKKEYELLLLLVSKVGNVFTREHIYESLWGERMVVGERTIDVHVRRLREKIGDDCIKTLKGIGYKFNTDCETG